jgi:hypothetical protein
VRESRVMRNHLGPSNAERRVACQCQFEELLCVGEEDADEQRRRANRTAAPPQTKEEEGKSRM